MTIPSLDKIGLEAAKLLQSGQRNVSLAQSKLRQVWAAFDEAKENGTEIEINGVKSKTAWAEHWKVSMRYCQYVVKDGSRKRSEKKDANPVRVITLKHGSLFKVDGVTYRIPEFDPDSANQTDTVSSHSKPWLQRQGDTQSYTNVTIHGCEIVEDRTKEPKSKKKKQTKKEYREMMRRANPKAYAGDFMTMPAKPKKTHVRSAQNGEFTGCKRGINSDVNLVEDDPSCRLCQNHLQYTRGRAVAAALEKSTPGMSKKHRDALWMKYATQGGELAAIMGGLRTMPEGFKFPHEKPPVWITHIYGSATAGGGQNTRMRDYALCGRNFTPRSRDGGMTIPESGRVHVSITRGEEPTCPECIKLAKDACKPTIDVMLKEGATDEGAL